MPYYGEKKSKSYKELKKKFKERQKTVKAATVL
jgi:hypothetical protein